MNTDNTRGKIVRDQKGKINQLENTKGTTLMIIRYVII